MQQKMVPEYDDLEKCRNHIDSLLVNDGHSGLKVGCSYNYRVILSCNYRRHRILHGAWTS